MFLVVFKRRRFVHCFLMLPISGPQRFIIFFLFFITGPAKAFALEMSLCGHEIHTHCLK